MLTKRFRMFCGPNGSGKSTLIEEINKNYKLGYFINADVIKNKLDTHHFLKSSDFCSTIITHEEWKAFLDDFKKDDRVQNFDSKLFIENNIIVCKSQINSYEAALLATFFRHKLIKEKTTFSFETVMSHPSKVTFIDQAKKAGFKTYLYFVCTQDPDINKQRVLNRVKKGGHAVNEEKIVARYYRSLNLLYDAFQLSDRAFVLDSSNQKRNLIVEKKKDTIHVREQNIPEWVATYLLDRY